MKENIDIVKANERDIVSGRGNAISARPGNVYFRQVVNKFREEYVNAPRDRKVAIALRVIDIVHKNGSRFLQETEVGSGQFYRISDARAIEKCCQALREKVVSNPPQGNPFEKLSKKRDVPPRDVNFPSKKAKASSPNVPTGSKKPSKKSSPVVVKSSSKKLKRKYTRKPVSDLRESVSTLQGGVGDSMSTTKDVRVKLTAKKTETVSNENIRPLEQQDIILLMESPMNRLRKVSADEMLKKLHRFIDEHHHAAVPPGWSADPDLADWCTMQRQRLRMAKKGYKELSPEETKLVATLSSLNFVWDFDTNYLEQITQKK